MIFQDISGACLPSSLESYMYFERVVPCAYLLLAKEKLCALFFSMVLLLVLHKLFWFVLYFGSCLVNNAWLKAVSIEGAFSFIPFSTRHHIEMVVLSIRSRPQV